MKRKERGIYLNPYYDEGDYPIEVNVYSVQSDVGTNTEAHITHHQPQTTAELLLSNKWHPDYFNINDELCDEILDDEDNVEDDYHGFNIYSHEGRVAYKKFMDSQAILKQA